MKRVLIGLTVVLILIILGISWYNYRNSNAYMIKILTTDQDFAKLLYLANHNQHFQTPECLPKPIEEEFSKNPPKETFDELALTIRKKYHGLLTYFAYSSHDYGIDFKHHKYHCPAVGIVRPAYLYLNFDFKNGIMHKVVKKGFFYAPTQEYQHPMLIENWKFHKSCYDAFDHHFYYTARGEIIRYDEMINRFRICTGLPNVPKFWPVNDMDKHIKEDNELNERFEMLQHLIGDWYVYDFYRRF